MFGIGEYYFLQSDYGDARRILDMFIEKFPGSKARIFAMAYLLEIDRRLGRDVLPMEKDIVSFMKVTLLFRDYKIYRFNSVLRNKYKVIYFIDNVQFYVNEKLFCQVSY